MSSDEMSGGDVRASKRAQREAERAARAQRKADVARQRAVEAARAGGLFEGMQAMPESTTSEDARRASESDVHGTTSAVTGTGTAAGATGRGSEAGYGSASSQWSSETGRTAGGGAPGRAVLAALAVATVALLGLTGFSTWNYVQARDAAATEQRIADAPAEATDAAREIATQMFTYDHRTVDSELAAVRDRLTDPALKEFIDTSMPAVASAAKSQEASVMATVAAAAAEEVVDEDHVTVLVMLNRMISTKEDPKAASSASRLRVQMERVDGEWKLAELNSL